MIPSITEIPKRPIKPIAAETLNGVPVKLRAKIPPISAIGITLIASSVSTNEEKFAKSNRTIRSTLSGTTTARRPIASCSSPNSPTHSRRVPAGDVAIDVDIDRGLAKRIKDGEVVHAWHRCQNILDLVRSFLERFEIVAEELDGVLAFNPRSGFFDVVLDVLRKVKIDPRKPSFQRGIHLLGKLLLIDTARPSIERLERNI